MNELIHVDAAAEVQILVPEQADFYKAQLRAVANLALQGGGPNIGAGSGANQYYLHVGGTAPQNVSSLVWRSPHDALSVNFAVLPPQQAARQYFGTARSNNPEGSEVSVEGVDLHASGSRYGNLLVSYNEIVEPGNRVPLAIGAFVNRMRTDLLRPDEESPITTVVGLEPNAHRRLGNALLTFWDTVVTPADLSVESSQNRGAYDLTSLILKREVELAMQGKSDGRHDALTPYRDARGNVIGFMGTNEQFVTVMMQDNTAYPNKIDYIAIPLPRSEEENVMVAHYVMSRHGVSTRMCPLPAQIVTPTKVNELVAKIQLSNEPFDPLEPEALKTVTLGLHDQLGSLLRVES